MAISISLRAVGEALFLFTNTVESFALHNSDYADNWQGFMDGAMEEGFRKSMAIIREFKMQRKDAKL